MSLLSAGIINTGFPPDGATAAFDYESGSGEAIDRTGNGHESVNHPRSQYMWDSNTPYGDYCLSLGGYPDFCECGPIFGESSVYEVQLKFRPESGNGKQALFDQDGLLLGYWNRNTYRGVELGVYGGYVTHPADGLALDTWHDVYFRYEPGVEIVIELNGDRVSADDPTSGGGGYGNDFHLGVNPYGTGSHNSYFDGRMDNVALAQGDEPKLR